MSVVLDVPVAFLVFNRPDLTSRVFACIRAAQPKELFVIADGPRSPEEREACDQTRAIATAVDWDCVVRTNFSETNLGCGKRVSSGLNWLFENCEQAIILEDDCVPDPSFFPYCTELLTKYCDDDRVAMISGDNFQQSYSNDSRGAESYYFSRLAHIWGWATWRRAWKDYDFEMKDWPAVKASAWLRITYGNGPQTRLWERNFEQVYSGHIDTWDTQWQYAVLRNNALVILPIVNLISNIGFGESATHTKTINDQACLGTGAVTFPLSHPQIVTHNRSRDEHTFREIFLPALKKQSVWQRLKGKANRILSRSTSLFSPKRSDNPI
jgi:hypothetical protein